MKRVVRAKSAFLIFLLGVFFAPSLVFATECSPSGATVVFVNGIFTDSASAERSKKFLQDGYRKQIGREDVKFVTGYNPSHLAGGGDLTQLTAQMFGVSVSNLDRNTILRQIHSQINTQKILLLGHSQGTFYTNEMYEYLVENGVPKESIAVYNIATPASYVAGGGRYLTSTNDMTIEEVARAYAKRIGAEEPLPANITISLSLPDVPWPWTGHSFVDEYLTGASGSIIPEIDRLLSSLSVRTATQEQEGCFDPPAPTSAERSLNVALSLLDPMSKIAVAPLTEGYALGQNILRFAEVGIQTLGNKGGDLIITLLNATSSFFNFRGQERLTIDQGAAVASVFNEQEESVQVAPPPPPAPQPPVVVNEIVVETPPQLPVPEQVEVVVTPPPPTAPPTPPAPLVDNNPGARNLFPVPDTAIGGGGGGGSSGGSGAPTPTPTPSPPNAPTISSPSSGSVFATTTITFGGTAEADSIISQDFNSSTTTADGNGNWSLTLSGFSEGYATTTFKASNSDGDSSGTEVATRADLTAPSVTATVTECSYSFVSGTCVLINDAVTLAWSSVDSDIVYAEFYKDGASVGTSTSATQSISLSTGTTTLSVALFDEAGFSATSTEQTVVIIESPLVIYEVAWAGTAASSNDEWLEIKNISNYDLNLSSVSLYSADGAPYIKLSGTLLADDPDTNNDVYLIERTSTVTTADHKLIDNFDLLSDSGEELILALEHETGTTTLDRTPTIATCSGWCAGDSAHEFVTTSATTTVITTMERASTTINGALKSAWQSNDTYSRSGSDSAGGTIYGTPDRENSAGLPPYSWYCGNDSPISAGDTYTPSSTSCTYLLGFITPSTSVTFFANMYKGTIASSTRIEENFFSGKSRQVVATDPLSGASSSDSLFVAIYEVRLFGSHTDDSDFNDYFQYGSTTPPHSVYRTLEWTMGN